MDNNKLFKFAIILALSGILLLFILSKNIELEQTPIEKIDESYIGKTVKIVGSVTKVNNVGNNTIININNSNPGLVIFSKIIIKNGANVLIIGKVGEYNNELQIQIDKLELIS